MDWYSVYVESRTTHQMVCILDIGTRSEAAHIANTIKNCNTCDVRIIHLQECSNEERNGF